MPPVNLNELMANKLAKDCLIPMGLTAENVAEKWGITREMQDQMAVDSHTKALAAQANGHFKAEIVGVPVEVDGKVVMVDADDGPRKTTLDGLGALKTVFKKEGGTVTAGTASQVSDGAAAVLLMRRSKATELGVKPIGVFRGAKVCGVDPKVMGIGPAEAVPLALAAAGLKMDDVDIFEINEAFAAQAVMCVQTLGVPAEKLNPSGGAIALGHPLGATGARQVATLLHGLHRTGKTVGVVSMCIGTGMGMAAVFEAEK
jgi:acetyl-CoA acyltransferase 1